MLTALRDMQEMKRRKHKVVHRDRTKQRHQTLIFQTGGNVSKSAVMIHIRACN